MNRRYCRCFRKDLYGRKYRKEAAWHPAITKPTGHASLNPDDQDKLNEDQLQAAGREYMEAMNDGQHPGTGKGSGYLVEEIRPWKGDRRKKRSR